MSDCGFNLNSFCYVCGKFVNMPSRKKISDEICRIYEQYFNIPVVKGVKWAPSIICTNCNCKLLAWSKGTCEKMDFGIPMMWYETQNHDANNCYACANQLARLNRAKTTYKSVPSAHRPLPHSDSVPIPKRPSPTRVIIFALSTI